MPSNIEHTYHVVYLTGTPAAGKSTVAAQLSERIEPLEVFDYGERLLRYVKEKSQKSVTYAELRGDSSTIITPNDVAAVDELLIDWVRERRTHAHLVIDTHAVTKEGYGFRVTPFSFEQVKRLAPSQIIVIFTAPELARDRITQNAAGRRMPSEFEAGFHAALQGSVAVNYGIMLGVPIQFLDGGQELNTIVDWIHAHISRS